MNIAPARKLGDVCVYCRRARGVTWDHVVPLSRGGANETWNLRPCCCACNQEKGSRLPSEWLGSGCPQWAREIEGRRQPYGRGRLSMKLEVFDGRCWSVIDTGTELAMASLRKRCAEQLGVPWEALRVEPQ